MTLGVLCDQIIPPEVPMDEEEQHIRDRLRSLVIHFLTGEAKRTIIRHVGRPGTEAEEVLVNELLAVRNLHLKREIIADPACLTGYSKIRPL